MTLAEAEAVFEHWRDHPPTYQMAQILARLWGWKPAARAAAPADPAAIPAIPVAAKPVHQGLGAPVLDFAELKRRHHGR